MTDPNDQPTVVIRTAPTDPPLTAQEMIERGVMLTQFGLLELWSAAEREVQEAYARGEYRERMGAQLRMYPEDYRRMNGWTAQILIMPRDAVVDPTGWSTLQQLFDERDRNGYSAFS